MQNHTPLTPAMLSSSGRKRIRSMRRLNRAQRETGLLRSGSLLTGVSALVISSAALAQQTGSDPVVLDKLQVRDRTSDTNPYAEDGAPYKAKRSGDKRRVKELAETPQTIEVRTQAAIQEAGKTDLRDVLMTVPGITLGTGENGNAFGDRYIIRGHEARSDVFVDSLRDPGMTIRESFATEQVEVTKGPSSTFAGRGSTGGAVNSVTKQASPEYDFTKLQGGLGSDAYRRLTVDSNQKLSDELAVRVNLLHAYREVPERGPADKERNGIALSGTYLAPGGLSLLADYYYLDAKDKPDLGSYVRPNGGTPIENIPVYLQNEDFLNSKVAVGTVRAGYDFSDHFRIENAFRYGTTDNGYVVTGARGTTRASTDPQAPGVDTIGLSTHQGWQEIGYIANQLNLFYDTKLADMKHQFVLSTEYTSSDVLNGTYNVTNTGATNCITAGRRGDSPGYCLTDPNGAAVSNAGSLLGRQVERSGYDSDYSIDTISLSLMDTVDLTDRWAVSAGIRLDSFDYNNRVRSTNRTTGEVTETDYTYSDTLWNGQFGVTYKISNAGTAYFNYGSSANINGGESDVGGSCGYGGLCGDTTQVTDSKAERTGNLELGTKWNLFDKKLLVTAAVFQATKRDVMENVGDDYASLGTLNTGKNRVRGIDFSLAGKLTKRISTVAGFTLMKAEVLGSFNPDNIGKTLSNFADKSAYVQVRHQTTSKFSFGGAVKYSAGMYVGQPDTAAGYSASTGEYSYRIPSYAVLDLFAQYKFTNRLNLRLNVGNATNKDYYLAGYRSGAFAYLGDARNANVTLSYEF